MGEQSIKTVAIFFGGRSVEHDVSVLTALQFISALDPLKYKPLPVYIDPFGQFWSGSPLLNKKNYPINPKTISLTQLHLDIARGQTGQPAFTSYQKGRFKTKTVIYPFDIAVPAIHGSNGEDGSLQGMFEFASIPYAGCRPLAAAATMDKAFAKEVLASQNIDVLPHAILNKPAKGQFLSAHDLKQMINKYLPNTNYPYIVKPCHLGSSVGVEKADNEEDLLAHALAAFRLDHKIMIEPFVENLTEYNIAVKREASGDILVSAIEEPTLSNELLDFKNKYLSGSKSGKKIPSNSSEGMASLGRTLQPESLSSAQKLQIKQQAITAFEALDLAGSIRIDFLCNKQTGQLWMNEINTIPGSFAYFLWEAAERPIDFQQLTTEIIEEGFALSRMRKKSAQMDIGRSSIF